MPDEPNAKGLDAEGWSYIFGNLDALGGLSPQAHTLAQDEPIPDEPTVTEEK